MMTSRRSVLLLATLGTLLSCCCVDVLSFSAGPAASVCNDATQTPTGHGVPAQTSASPYQLVVGVTSYESSDTSTPVTGKLSAVVSTRKYIKTPSKVLHKIHVRINAYLMQDF